MNKEKKQIIIAIFLLILLGVFSVVLGGLFGSVFLFYFLIFINLAAILFFMLLYTRIQHNIDAIDARFNEFSCKFEKSECKIEEMLLRDEEARAEIINLLESVLDYLYDFKASDKTSDKQ